MAMSDIIDVPCVTSAARTSYTTLAAGIAAALSQQNLPEVVQLAWLLIFRPDCPLELQVHAVLVHSAASLALGVNPDIVEHNIKAMIYRLAGGTELSRLALRGRIIPWKLEALKQLRAALVSLDLRREKMRMGGDTRGAPLPPSPPPPPRSAPACDNDTTSVGGRRPVVDSVVDGLREMDLDRETLSVATSAGTGGAVGGHVAEAAAACQQVVES